MPDFRADLLSGVGRGGSCFGCFARTAGRRIGERLSDRSALDDGGQVDSGRGANRVERCAKPCRRLGREVSAGAFATEHGDRTDLVVALGELGHHRHERLERPLSEERLLVQRERGGLDLGVRLGVGLLLALVEVGVGDAADLGLQAGLGVLRLLDEHRLLTLGTGVGSALAYQGVVVPMELGHLQWKGRAAEKRVAASVREKKDLSWPEWGGRLNEYLDLVERILWPERIIIGGGVSAKFEKFSRFVKPKARLVPARLLNHAGIVGAALAAETRA